MPPKQNPLGLNPLQLRTLTLFQAMAVSENHVVRVEEDGSVVVAGIPAPHGDHFHLGDAVVRTDDATGLANPAVWTALERKGLIRSHFPEGAVLTPAAMTYDTGLAGSILHRFHGH